MQLKAYAKINLTLDILGKRKDGFHELESVMQQVDLADDIFMERLNNNKISIDCQGIPQKKNLVFKSAFFLKNNFNINAGVEIKITKNIPIAAGLGGGSADAAAVIKGLNKLWGLSLTTEELVDFAAKTGSDVPFSIIGGTALVKGRGEIVKKLDNFPALDLIIINPGFGVKTKDAYEGLNPPEYGQQRKTAKLLKKLTRENIVKNLHNDFEETVFKKYPEIEAIKNEIISNGALNAIMSGSGSSVFGVFENKEEAKSAYDELKDKYPFVYLTKTK